MNYLTALFYVSAGVFTGIIATLAAIMIGAMLDKPKNGNRVPKKEKEK